jgi:hypothetical protein
LECPFTAHLKNKETCKHSYIAIGTDVVAVGVVIVVGLELRAVFAQDASGDAQAKNVARRTTLKVLTQTSYLKSHLMNKSSTVLNCFGVG